MIDRETGYRAADRLSEMVRDNNFLLHVLSRFDIASGSVHATAGSVCARNQVHTPTFLAVCNLISGYPYDIESVDLASLISYLRHAHRSILEITLPHIRHHLVEGIGYTEDGKIGLMLMRFLDEYTAEVRNHMDHEDQVVFSHAEQLINGETPGEKFSGYIADHKPMSQKLRELKDIFIYHYSQRDNDRLSAVLFDIILCERDLSTHFDVENKLFIPLISRLERRKGADTAAPVRNNKAEQQTRLGEREKEIIHYVAKGLSNKEISDKLCLSAHTVATHRRNICAKLDIHSASGLTLYAIVNHLVDINEISPK